MRPRRRPALNFGLQTLLLQLATVLLAVLVTTGVHAWLTYQLAGEEAEQRALAVARTVAAADAVRAEVAHIDAADTPDLSPQELAHGPLLSHAEEVRERTGALFVVVTDGEGTRLTHPDRGLLGLPVSTDPVAAREGVEVTDQEQGTLGLSARAKVPVRAPGSEAVVGQVSVGFGVRDIRENLRDDIGLIALTAAGALALGVAASWLLSRRLRRLTLGLEPEEITELVLDQEAVLRGVDDGVIGVAADGRLTVVNAKARTLLGLDLGAELAGTPIGGAGLPATVVRLVAEASAAPHAETPAVNEVVGPRVLILSARAVRGTGPGSPELGTVVMMRDRTQLQDLTKQLEAVSAMTGALRAQRHEFANRLHTVFGLLNTGRHDEAEEYVGGLLAADPLRYSAEQTAALGDPFLRVFAGAKAIEAAERGVQLRIGPETLVRGRVADPHDVATVLGNLIDNAVRAAVQGAAPQRWVEVEALDELTGSGGTLHLVVADSGDGTAHSERVFEEGFSTATTTPLDTHGQGLGLFLCRRLAEARGGAVWLADPGRPGGPGAVFCARLPGTIRPPEPETGEGPEPGGPLPGTPDYHADEAAVAARTKSTGAS